jgi:CubicO group peptidase (beta-lactamase class C family)
MVETVSGEKLDRYFQEYIFGPLGMPGYSVTRASMPSSLPCPVSGDPHADGWLCAAQGSI